MNDVRKVIFGTIIGFFGMLAIWFSIIYVSACGMTFTCHQAAQKVDRTPIPTLIPVSHEEARGEDMNTAEEFNKCQVAALDLVGAWVSASAPETEAFPFVDVNGQSCTGTYTEDVQPLFVENSVWHVGEIGCISCHNADAGERNGGLDMVSYVALSQSGVLGNGDWETSKLHEILKQGLVPAGHSAEASANNPLLFAGAVVPAPEATVTPAP